MKPITKSEQMEINGGAHYHWSCYYKHHNYLSAARTKFSAAKWRDYHNDKYHFGKKRAKLSKACKYSCGRLYKNLP